MQVKTIGICTGGGDCPGLNAVIRAVVKSAILTQGWRVLGIQDSFEGLIWPAKVRELQLNDVSGLLPRGGTILGTTNRLNPLEYRFSDNGGSKICDATNRCVSNARALGLDALIVAGGDGTMRIALQLYRKGLPLVGVPKTIDNDLPGTEVSFGFDTALHTAMDAMDKIHTSAESHHRVMMVELMGREAGWIALQAGMASGADVILIPEIPFKIENVCQAVRRRDEAGKNFTIIAVAEGIHLPSELQAELARQKQCPASVTEIIRREIGRRTGKETRLTVLGHVQRGGSPSPFDRILCTRFGVGAVELVARGEFGRMLNLKDGRVQSVPLEQAVQPVKLVDPQGEMVLAARAVGTSFGD
jgi:ATP-dependent phosphofructokinase / diphosphate-dependent phosphofructokinase